MDTREFLCLPQNVCRHPINFGFDLCWVSSDEGQLVTSKRLRVIEECFMSHLGLLCISQ